MIFDLRITICDFTNPAPPWQFIWFDKGLGLRSRRVCDKSSRLCLLQRSCAKEQRLLHFASLSSPNRCQKSQAGYVIAKQVLRSGTSVAANYRAVCRARSRADFISKLGIVVEEIDETLFWLELIVDAGLLPSSRMESIMNEANQLTSIFVAARKTSRSR